MDQDRGRDRRVESPPPPYSRLSSPRPPPAQNIPWLASGRPNAVDSWDYEALIFRHTSGRQPATPAPPPAYESSSQLFENRDVDDYLGSPFTHPAAPGKDLILTSRSDTRWLHCNHKVFPAFWRCMYCPPHDCFDPWRLRELDADPLRYRPRCPRPACGAAIGADAVLVNTQKESIMTVAGENLMPSRVEEPFVWCCKCASLRGEDRGEGPGCAHCADFRHNTCRDCIRCNKFLEPTRFCNGDRVKFGVLHLHGRAAGRRARQADADVRSARRLLFDSQLHLDDPRSDVWDVIVSSIMLLGALYLRATSQQRARRRVVPTWREAPGRRSEAEERYELEWQQEGERRREARERQERQRQLQSQRELDYRRRLELDRRQAQVLHVRFDERRMPALRYRERDGFDQRRSSHFRGDEIDRNQSRGILSGLQDLQLSPGYRSAQSRRADAAPSNHEYETGQRPYYTRHRTYQQSNDDRRVYSCAFDEEEMAFERAETGSSSSEIL